MINQLILSFVLDILILGSLVTGIKFSDTQDAEIDQLLKKLNKPALKSIQSPDGDIIDCVHINNHPIYDHPLFKNHTIQTRPSTHPKGLKNEPSYVEKKGFVTQLWTTNGKCPKNSIPIRRTKREDILRAKSIERYGKKDFNNIPENNQSKKHEYALIETHGMFHGARAIINVWKPYVQKPEEFSLAQIWIVAGSRKKLNSIEFGWQVYPGPYDGDINPRFFVYWTADGYDRTGCYNLNCPGFVLVSHEFALNTAVHNVSILNGHQYEIPSAIWKDPRTENWWLKVYDHLFVGYWPSMLFNDLQSGATKIKFGGEITDLKVGGQHTTTKMGSGNFAQQGYKNASYFRNIEMFDQYNSWKPFQSVSTFTTESACYNVRTNHNSDWGNYFYYGGPGKNVHCE